MQRSITIGKPAEELYRLWRDPTRLASLVGTHVHAEVLSDTRVRWRAEAPFGRKFQWDTLFVEDRSPESLAWRAETGAPVPHEGSIRFRPAPGEKGTVVTLRFQFDPPGAAMGDLAAKWLHGIPEMVVARVLRRFKSLAETGEIPTLEKNPSGRARHEHPQAARAAS